MAEMISRQDLRAARRELTHPRRGLGHLTFITSEVSQSSIALNSSGERVRQSLTGASWIRKAKKGKSTAYSGGLRVKQSEPTLNGACRFERPQ